MNLFKVILVLVTGAGFGFGIDQISHTEIIPNDEEMPYTYEDGGFCHRFNNDEFLDHMLEGLSEEEQTMVNTKVEELLVTYDTTLEEVNSNYELRQDFMLDLMTFLNDNDIVYHYDGYHHGGFYNDDEFLEHMLEGLTEEEQVLVNAKIDELLLTYDTTLEELNSDFELRQDFMLDLMTFLDENDIDFYHGGYHHGGYYDDDSWPHHRRMR